MGDWAVKEGDLLLCVGYKFYHDVSLDKVYEIGTYDGTEMLCFTDDVGYKIYYASRDYTFVQATNLARILYV